MQLILTSRLFSVPVKPLRACVVSFLHMHDLREDEASAALAREFVEEAVMAHEPLDERFIERAAARIHAAWLSRNVRVAEEHQRRAYPALSEEEKEKDRRFVRAAIGTAAR